MVAVNQAIAQVVWKAVVFVLTICKETFIFQLFWSAQMKDELSSQILSGPLQEHRKVLKGVSICFLYISLFPALSILSVMVVFLS